MSISYGVGERLKIKRCSSPEQVISELRGVTCHVGSLSVTCHPTQVNTPPLNPRQTGGYVICLPQRNRKLSVPRWFGTYLDGLSVNRQLPIQVVTGPGVKQLG